MFFLKIKERQYLILWLGIIVSIGAENSLLQDNLGSFYVVIDKLRFLLGVLCSILVLIIFLYKFNLEVFDKKYKILNYFLIYFILIFLSSIIHLREKININETFLPVFSIALILLSIKILEEEEEEEEKIISIYNYSLFFLAISTIYNLIKFFKIFINTNIFDIYSLSSEDFFLNQNSNGVARSLLIFSTLIYIKKNHWYNYILLTLVNTIIFYLQSKLSIIFLILVFLIFCVLDKKNIIKKTIITIILPLFIIFSTNYYKSNFVEKNNISTETRIEREIKESISVRNITPLIKTFKHRIDAWNEIINKNNNYILGNGIQADRKLTMALPSHNQLASNSMLYAYACGGIAALSVLLKIYYEIILILINYYKKNFYNKEAASLYLIILFITVRSIIENSFALWGIDLLLFIIAYLKLRYIKT